MADRDRTRGGRSTGAVYRWLLGYVRPHWPLVAAGFVAMGLASLFEGVSLGMAVPFVDRIISGEELVFAADAKVPAFLERLAAAANAMPPERLVNILVGVMAGALLLKAVFLYVRAVAFRVAGQRIVRSLQREVFAKFLELGPALEGGELSGALAARVTHDTTMVEGFVTGGLANMGFQVLRLAVLVSLALVIRRAYGVSWWLLGATALVFPATGYPVSRLARRIKELGRRRQEQLAALAGVVQETLRGIRVVAAYRGEAYRQRHFDRASERFYRTAVKVGKRTEGVGPLTDTVAACAGLLVLWLGVRQVLAGALPAGAFLGILGSLMGLARPVTALGKLHSLNQQIMASAERILEVLERQSPVRERPGARPLAPLSRGITYDGVWFSYGGEPVLRGVDLEIARGEKVAIVGASGAGKTTLVSLLPRFFDPDRGAVLVDGVDVRDVTLASLRGQIALVTQETVLFNDTVAANVAFGAEGVTMEQIERACRLAHCHEFITRLPRGYQTVIAEAGCSLSGGERQRLAIARAILRDPQILILDEATSQVDAESERLIQDALARLMEGRTVLVIAHRFSSFARVDRVVMLEGGRITAVGKHAEMMESNETYRRLCLLQMGAGAVGEARDAAE